jgi:hypothetical protein
MTEHGEVGGQQWPLAIYSHSGNGMTQAGLTVLNVEDFLQSFFLPQLRDHKLANAEKLKRVKCVKAVS